MSFSTNGFASMAARVAYIYTIGVIELNLTILRSWGPVQVHDQVVIDHVSIW